MSRDETQAISRLLLSEDQWQAFLKKGSADLARTIEGVRCRFNIFETSRGVGLAIRLLSSVVPTIETTNLHPSLNLVFATMHSGTCIEALARIVSAFPAEIQSSVAAQLGNALGAIVCQRLPFHKDLGIRIPECEILRTTPGVKNDIRRGEYAQITNAMEMGAETGMWTFDRYCEWVAARSDWYIPSRGPHARAVEPSVS